MSKTRMGKRIASLLLSLVMMLSLLPTTVYAAAGTADKNGVSVVGSTAPAAAQEEGVDNAAAGEGENGDVGENGGDAVTGDAADSALTTQSGDTEMPVTYAEGETETVVAKIGETGYATLAGAIEAATDGATIMLVANTELTESLTVNTTVILDLAGCTITGALTIGTNGNLTIDDSVGDGKITSTGTTITANGGTLTLNGGTIESTSASDNDWAIYLQFNSKAAVTINKGGTVRHTEGSEAIQLRSMSAATLYVNGGTVEGKQYGIHVFNGGTVEISDGTVNSTNSEFAVCMGYKSTLKATGGTVNGIAIEGNSTNLTVGKENGTSDDVKISLVDLKPGSSSSANAATVYLYSGTVKEFRNYDNMTVPAVGEDRAFLTGTDITSRLPGADLKCMEGADGLYYVTNLSEENAEAKVLHDGVETPYNTVGQAVTALQDGDTLTLNTDYTGTIAVQEKNIVIDLGGHTVTATGLQANAVNIAQSATESNTVTVKNGTVVQKGQDNSAIFVKMNNAGDKTMTLMLENVTLTESSNARASLVQLGEGARTAVANKAYVTNGGLQVVERDGTWIYGTANTAFTHANGRTVTLLNNWYNTDYDGAVRVPEDASYTSAVLDLNGNTIEYYGSVSAIAIGGSGNNYVDGTNAKSLTVKNGAINVNSGSGAAIGGSNKTLILDGVTLTTTGTEKCGIFTNGMTTGNTVTLTNSSITAEKGIGIYFPGAGKLTVENTNVTGSVSGIEIRAGVLNVSGTSAIKSTAAEFKFEDNDNGSTTTGAAIAAVKHGVGNDLTVNIEGGTFSGLKALYQADSNADKAGTVTMKVTGGTFNGAVTAEPVAKFISGGTLTEGVDETYLADGYVYNAADKTVKADTSVAAIGTTKYATLKEAINAARTGDTITLLADVNLGTKGQYLYSAATDKKDVCNLTFDLNGHKITSSSTSYTVSASREGLVIKNGTITNESDKTGQKTCAVYVTGAGTTTFENVTLSAKGSGVYVGLNNGEAIVNVETGTSISGKYGVYLKGATDKSTYNGKETLNVNDGKITGTAAGVCVVGPGSGSKSADDAAVTVNVTGGEVSSVTTKSSNSNRAAAVTISGGTVTGDLKNTGKDVITITGGTFKGAVTKLDINGTIAISGGTFAIEPDTTYLVKGYTITENADNTYGVKKTTYVAEVNSTQYDTLEDAIAAAGRKTTVTMLANTKENVTISTSDLTLDLNGFTLNGGTVANKPALTVTAARVTVKDSSEKQTGTIMREDTAENSGVSSHYVIDIQGSGLLFFESGNVKNNSGTTEGKGASLVRVGDDSVAKYPGLTIKGGTFTQDNFIAIKVERGTFYLNDGEVNSANSYAIENRHRAIIQGGTVNGTVSTWVYSTGAAFSELEISGGIINGDVTSVNCGDADKVAKVKITGGTVTGELDTRSYDPTTDKLTSIDDAAKATIEVTSGTFNSNPSKYVVEGSTVKTNTDGTYGVEKAYLAKIGETGYYTMNEAFQAVKEGETITLLRDYTTGATQNSGSKSYTIDLNNFTWTCTGTDANSAAFEINYPDVTLTVKSGKVASSQLVGLIPSAMGGTIKYDNSGLVFEGVEMSTTATSGIETNGNNTNDTVTLRNSTLNVPNGFGIYFPSSGTLTIDNSTINAKTMGVQVCAGSLSINEGSAITVTGDAVPKTENDGAIQDGAAISIVNRTGYKGLGDVTVTGGTFTAKKGNAAIKAYDWNSAAEAFTESGKVAVSGGTFSSAVDADLCKTGYAPTVNEDGTYTVTKVKVAEVNSTQYDTLEAAIAAAKTGDTVKLLADVEQNARLVIDKSITLDLNGKKICNTRDIWNESNALIGIGTDETRVQVTITGSGTIAARENDCYTIDVKNGDLTIENGEFIGNVSAVQVQTGTLTINGGKFSLLQKWKDKSTYLINCIDGNFADGSAKVAIYGGTFVDFDPNVSPEKKVDGKAPSFAAPGVGITKSDDNFTAYAGRAIQILDENDGSIDWYSNLVNALRWVEKGYTVRLLQDYVEVSQPEVKDEVTIDGQGKYSITVEDNGYSYITVSSGKLTLSDVTITGMSNTCSLLYVKNTATITIDKDSKLIANGSEPAIFLGSASDTDSATPTVNIYGRVEGETAGYLIAGNGSYKGTSYINIYDDAVVKAGKLAMFLPQPCEVNITGGTVEGYCAIGIKSGTLNITGGQVLGVAENNELSDNNSVGSGMQYDGSAIVIDSHTGYKGNVNINISGSAFIQSRCSTGIREIGNDADKTNVKGLSISGGTVLSGSGMGAVQVREVTKKNVSITGGSFSTNVGEYCTIDYQCNKPTEDEPLYTVTKKDADEIDVKRSLTLDNSLTMNYKVKLPSGYENPKVEFEFYDGSVSRKEYIATTVTEYTYNETTGRYVFAFTGINPQRMNDTLKATVYATNVDTQEVTAFPVDDYSVAQYCNALLTSDYNKNGEWDKVIGTLVAYGTASQEYMGYRVTDLVKDAVGNAKTIPDYSTDVNTVNVITGDSTDVKIESRALILSSGFAIRVKFTLADGVNIENVTFTVSGSGEKQTITTFDKGTLSNGTACYYFDFENLNAKQLGTVMTFASSVNGVNSQSLQFNMNAYLVHFITNETTEAKWKALARALYNYGQACAEYGTQS